MLVYGGIGFHGADLVGIDAVAEDAEEVVAGFQEADVGFGGVGDHDQGVVFGELAGELDVVFDGGENIAPVADEFIGRSVETEAFAHGVEELIGGDASGFVVVQVGADLAEGFPECWFGERGLLEDAVGGEVEVEVDEDLAEVEEDGGDLHGRELTAKMRRTRRKWNSPEQAVDRSLEPE
ncbi:MAG: hypothetical protein HC841_07385 [Verrucomicrobiae bacterium]|nr:hypothetical protein [Verrucomicrobiae bacterium]